MSKTVQLKNGKSVPPLGIGTWMIGEEPTRETQEIEAILTGIRAGMTLIDTAEMYGEGRSEILVGKALKQYFVEGSRDDVFVVSKVLPWNAGKGNMRKSCVNSLERLGLKYLDMYLYHWIGNVPLKEVVEGLNALQDEGLIRSWGVSNFDTGDLQDLLAVEDGGHCFCNQIFYSIYERGCEKELLPLMRELHILPMSYSSLGSDYYPHPDIHQHPEIMALCRAEKVPPEAMMLRWNAEQGFCTLFSTSSLPHLRDNLQEVPEEAFRRFQLLLERDFPAPAEGYPLVKI